jgi:hypothetical protein
MYAAPRALQHQALVKRIGTATRLSVKPRAAVRPRARHTACTVCLALAPTVANKRRVARGVEVAGITLCFYLAVCGAPNAASHGAMLLMEGAYVALHALPLLSLRVPSVRRISGAFMDVFTTGGFFAGELLWYSVLLAGAPVIRTLPPAAFAAHVTAHVVYTAVAAVAPSWAVQQNVRRVSARESSSRSSTLLLAAWDFLLNVLNALDAGMHCVYAYLLSTELPRAVAPVLFVAGAVITIAACRRHL